MTSAERIERVRAEFPKFSKPCLSLSLRTPETGVQLCPRAALLAGFRKPAPHRTKTVRFSARLTPDTGAAVKAKMEAEGIASTQTLIEALLLAWVRKD